MTRLLNKKKMFEFMQPVADTLGLSLETILIITGVVGFVFSLFAINIIVASLSETKRAPSNSARLPG